MRSRLHLSLFVCALGCGNITRAQHDAGPDDAPTIDASIDASIDAPDQTESRELATGGAALTGPTYTFEIEVGHSFQQSEISGPTYRFEGNAAVKP